MFFLKALDPYLLSFSFRIFEKVVGLYEPVITAAGIARMPVNGFKQGQKIFLALGRLFGLLNAHLFRVGPQILI